MHDCGFTSSLTWRHEELTRPYPLPEDLNPDNESGDALFLSCVVTGNNILTFL